VSAPGLAANSAGERFRASSVPLHRPRAERGDCGGGTGWKRRRQIGKKSAGKSAGMAIQALAVSQAV